MMRAWSSGDSAKKRTPVVWYPGPAARSKTMCALHAHDLATVGQLERQRHRRTRQIGAPGRPLELDPRRAEVLRQRQLHVAADLVLDRGDERRAPPPPAFDGSPASLLHGTIFARRGKRAAKFWRRSAFENRAFDEIALALGLQDEARRRPAGGQLTLDAEARQDLPRRQEQCLIPVACGSPQKPSGRSSSGMCPDRLHRQQRRGRAALAVDALRGRCRRAASAPAAGADRRTAAACRGAAAPTCARRAAPRATGSVASASTLSTACCP